MNNAYLQSGRKPDSDECLTPRYVVEPIVKYLKEKEYKNIWCPFDKIGSQYVRVLESNGFNVINSHLDNGEDFFKSDKYKMADCIVSNPPFSKKTEILKHLYSLEIPFAMLLPQNSLQSIKRVELYKNHGLEYLGFDKRPCFYTWGNLDKIPMGNHFSSGYFCKDVLPEKLMFEKLEVIQEPYMTEINES